MYNYYNFNNLYDDNETVSFYNSLSSKQLNQELNNLFDNIEYYVNYYAEFSQSIFNGNDYDEHFYTLKSLSENLNDIKIILNILKEIDNHEK